MLRIRPSCHFLSAAGIVGLFFLLIFQATNLQASLFAQSDDDTANQQRNLNDQQNYLKNLKREVSDIFREAKTLDLTVVNGHIAQFEQCLQNVQGLIGKEEYWDANRDCSDHSREIEDQLNDVLRPARNCANGKRQIDDRRKEKKNNIDRQIKDILRNDKKADVSQLTAITTQMDLLILKGDGLVSAGCNQDSADGLNDISNELGSLFQEFYSLSNEVNQKANDSRRLEDATKEFQTNIKKRCEKDFTREYKNFEKELTRTAKKSTLSPDVQQGINTVKSLYNLLCVDVVQRMQQAISQSDIDAVEEAKNDFYANEKDFWDALNTARGNAQDQYQREESLKNINQDLKNKEKELKRMNRELVKLRKSYDRLSKKYANASDRKDALATLRSFIERAQELTSRMTEGIAQAKQNAPQDPDSYWYENGDDLNELQNEFNEIQNMANAYSNVIQTLQGAEKQVKELERATARMSLSAEDRAELQSSITRAYDALKEAWNIAIESPEEASYNLMETFEELKSQWEEMFDRLEEDFE